MKAAEKYFRLYAEKEIREFDLTRLGRTYDYVSVIPVHGEGPELELALTSLDAAEAPSLRLTILVINGREFEATTAGANRFWLEGFGAVQKETAENSIEETTKKTTEKFTLFSFSERHDLLVVDRATGPWAFTKKEGVGLARKIGCDLAAWFIFNHKIKSAWINCSDADVEFPENYFRAGAAASPDDYSLLLHPYFHQKGPLESDHSLELARAYQLYEIYLRYYSLSLKKAGSPYAYWTIGSTQTISSVYYVQVRGFPKLLAAEDFYLFNKLVKLAPVAISDAPLRISGRESARVPFGTGTSVTKIKNSSEYLIYHPKIFQRLELRLQQIAKIIESGHWEPVGDELIDLCLRDAFAKRQGAVQRLKHFHERFDAFSTLKWIHSQEQIFPKLSWDEALRESGLFAQPNLARLFEIRQHLFGQELGFASSAEVKVDTRVEKST